MRTSIPGSQVVLSKYTRDVQLLGEQVLRRCELQLNRLFIRIDRELFLVLELS